MHLRCVYLLKKWSKPDLEPEPIWDASTAGGRFTHYATAPAPNVCLYDHTVPMGMEGGGQFWFRQLAKYMHA